MATDLAPVRQGSIRKLWDKHVHLKAKMERLNEQAEGMIEGLVRTVEVQGSAFVFGAIQGAWYDPRSTDDKQGAHFFGLPVEAVAGVGLHMFALLGVGGKFSSHLANFADGALAAYVSNLGRGWGYKFYKDYQTRKTTTGSTKGASLRDEIASLLE